MAVPCHLVHALRGRVRFRVPLIKAQAEVADALASFLQHQPGIDTVRTNRACGSVILTYDPACWTADGLVKLIEEHSPEALRTYRPDGALQKARRAAPARAPRSELVYSSIAVALGLVAQPLAPILVPWLLIAGACPMVSRAVRSLTQRGALNVDALDSLATALLVARGNLPAASFIVWIVNLADYIRDRTMERAHRALHEMLDFQPRSAWVIRDGAWLQVAVEAIRLGENVVVYPGERIPVDGTVISGKALVDQRVLTGEPFPIEKQAGDQVYAAAVVREGTLYLHAARLNSETEAAKIVRLIEDAPTRDTRSQNYAERWADRLVPLSVLGAGASVLFTGNTNRAASLLIIDYGTGIRIAAPMTVLAAMTKAARHGILIKGGRYLEQLAELDALVFDKTGTVTAGVPHVAEAISYGKSVSVDQVLTLAAAAEQRLSHPVAQAVAQAAQTRGLAIPERTASHYTIGLGVEAAIDGLTVCVGSQRFMAAKGIRLSQRAQRDLRKIEQQANAPLCVAANGRLIGLLEITDPLQPEAADVVQALRKRGVQEIMLLTGNRSTVAKRIADGLGIEHYLADVFPAQKVEVVKQLQRQGYKVGFVGDGINDAPALAQADVGIAVNGGTAIAQEIAHVTLLQGDLRNIPLAVDIAREGVSLIRQNWTLIAISNTLALALTAAGMLGPVGATLISHGSTILAAGNALRPLMNGASGPWLIEARR